MLISSQGSSSWAEAKLATILSRLPGANAKSFPATRTCPALGSFPLLSQSSQWQWNNLITGWSCQETWEIWHRKTSGNFQTYSVWEFFLGRNLKKSFVAKLLWTFFFLEFWLFCEIILVTLWNNSVINYSEEKIHLGNWNNVMIVCVPGAQSGKAH